MFFRAFLGLYFLFYCDSIKIRIEHKFERKKRLMSQFVTSSDNIIYLTEQSTDVLPPVLSFAERGGVMSTYEELMIILAVASLIVAILNLTHKK